jgi:type VI secretion system secreted protein Hcp
MAVDMFLKLDGIKGESQDDTHADEIDVLAWSWGCSQSGSTHMGKGGGAGKANFQDLSITKYVDKSSPNLLMAVAKGKHIKTATLTIRKAGDTPLEYLIYDLEDIIVSSVSTGGSGGEDRLTENVTLNFRIIAVAYTEQDEAGAGGAEISWGWDIAKNVTA